MNYHVLAMGIHDNLFSYLQTTFSPYGFRLYNVSTVHEIGRLLARETFHLLIVDLDYLRNIQQAEWLAGIRRISFVPVIVLSSTPETDFSDVVRLGADTCISSQLPHTIIAETAMAQLRRYIAYDHYDAPIHTETAPFQVGDIAIEPSRHIVWVCRQQVKLRPREFNLLLYFMRNPNIVLTSDQICKHAWGIVNGYKQGISHPIHLLREAIEPDPANPIYIKTIHHVGYCYVVNNDETCEMC